jgi:hypothetical protein
LSLKIQWNNKVKLIISDVDGTVADTYVNVAQDLIRELEQYCYLGWTRKFIQWFAGILKKPKIVIWLKTVQFPSSILYLPAIFPNPIKVC